MTLFISICKMWNPAGTNQNTWGTNQDCMILVDSWWNSGDSWSFHVLSLTNWHINFKALLNKNSIRNSRRFSGRTFWARGLINFLNYLLAKNNYLNLVYINYGSFKYYEVLCLKHFKTKKKLFHQKDASHLKKKTKSKNIKKIETKINNGKKQKPIRGNNHLYFFTEQNSYFVRKHSLKNPRLYHYISIIVFLRCRRIFEM